MKRLSYILLMLLCVAAKAQNEEGTNVGSTDEIRQNHDYVDLGLPSGTLWATTNIGAVNPQDYGWFFAWGETTPKEKYDDLTYRHREFGRFSNNNSLGVTDDAAAINWGSPWVVPTTEQMTELCNECYWVWTDNYNSSKIAGYIVYKTKDEKDKGVKKNKKDASATTSYTADDPHIFLPAAGYMSGIWVKYDGERGYYWSSSFLNVRKDYLYNTRTDVYDLHFNSGFVKDKNNEKPVIGHSVRPVRNK